MRWSRSGSKAVSCAPDKSRTKSRCGKRVKEEKGPPPLLPLDLELCPSQASRSCCCPLLSSCLSSCLLSLCYPHPSGCRQSSVCPAGTFRTRMKSAPLSVSEKSLLDIRYFGGRATTSMLILSHRPLTAPPFPSRLIHQSAPSS